MPAPPSNSNAMTHGLVAGKLPDGCSYVAKLCKKLRTSLEQACMARHGQVTLTMAATIQSCIRWERHSLLCQRWLRVYPGLSSDQQVAFSRDAARASAERDKCLRMLDLDAAADPMAELLAGFATETPAEPPQPLAIASAAPEPTVETPSPVEPPSEPPEPTVEGQSLPHTAAES